MFGDESSTSVTEDRGGAGGCGLVGVVLVSTGGCGLVGVVLVSTGGSGLSDDERDLGLPLLSDGKLISS